MCKQTRSGVTHYALCTSVILFTENNIFLTSEKSITFTGFMSYTFYDFLPQLFGSIKLSDKRYVIENHDHKMKQNLIVIRLVLVFKFTKPVWPE